MFKINRKQIVIYTAVITLLVFLYVVGFLKPVEAFVTRYLNPVISPLYKMSSGISRLYKEQTERSNVADRIKFLEAEMVELTKKNAELQSLEAENKVLREQLGFFAKNKYRYVMSNVISRGEIAESAGQAETIVIDKGSRDGINTGQAVLSANGIIVGKTIEVKDNVASVYLTNNPKCKLAATVLSQNNTSGIARGELGLTIKMDFIPQAVNIKPEDIVITSGLEQSIPRGLTIGKVITVNKENNELWQSAIIEPLSDSDDLNIVSVIIP